MGHLVKIHKKGIEKLISSGQYSIKANLKDLWIKTAADIFSDALCMRRGDYLFPWIIHDKETGDPNEGFNYIFKIKDGPYFEKGDDAPVKIILEDKGWRYKYPLTEDKALDLFSDKILWNMIGFKSAGRGKAITHQNLEEDNLLIQKLENITGQSKSEIQINKIDNSHLTKISTNNLKSFSEEEDKRIKSISKKSERLGSIDLNNFPYVKDNYFTYEKCLEAWLMENLDKDEVKNLIVGKDSKINWFANYIFYGVQGSNIDIVVDANVKENRVINVIELKVDKLSTKNLIDAITQLKDYEIFLINAYKSYKIDVNCQKILICQSLTKSSLVDKEVKDILDKEKIKLFFYEILNTNCKLKKFL